MIRRLKNLFRIIFGRTMVVILLLVIQVLILLAAFNWLDEYMTYLFGGFTLFGVLVVIFIINTKDNPIYKIAWMIPVIVIPVFGALFYVYMKIEIGTRLVKKKYNRVIGETKEYLKQDDTVREKIETESSGNSNLATYVYEYGGYPVYGNSSAEYFPIGEDMFEEMKKQLKSARKFIFMEYFIIEKGLMWDSILEILKEKVQEGVEVRVMYDGLCMLVLLPYHYPKELEKCGIRCKMYSPIQPALSSFQNNRDHRKITVIDGETAFTGGVNLADEYINQKVRFGHWKDTAVMIKGDAVKSFTGMFLQMWNITERKKEDYGKYLNITLPELQPGTNTGGFVMPFGDCPFDHEEVGERVYFDILNRAKRYVHIMTPYLIPDYEMMKALEYSAKRGVETSILLPHIPDKWYAFVLARSCYPALLEAGVHVYEYTPGFVHAKSFVSDDEKAVVGSINVDFRSLYLHFECGVYMYRNPVVQQVEDDFQKTIAVSHEITMEDYKKFSLFDKAAGRLISIFAPLM